VAPRILILSWEYPPIVAGGLARHVHKLSEALAGQGVEVHVLTRGVRDHVAEELRGGVHIHRVAESPMPHDLDAFVAWVEGMNAHMLAAGRRLGKRLRFDVVHGHDWLVAGAAAGLAERLRCPYLTTIHATEYGRHQGWVQQHPQSYVHGIETQMARRADHVITCSHYMRGHVADVYEIDERRVTVIPNGIDPADLQPVADLGELRARFAAPDDRLVLLVGRLVYEKGFQIALDALPQVIRRAGRVRFLVAGSGTHEAELKQQAHRLGLMRHGTFMGWIGDDVLHSLYRIADLCVVPSIYEPFGLVALEAIGERLPVHRGRHRRPARGRARQRRRPALPLARPTGARADDAARADRRRPARPARGRGVSARAALRLDRRGAADGGRLRGPRSSGGCVLGGGRPAGLSRQESDGGVLRAQRPRISSSAFVSPRPETIATTIRPVTTAGSRIAHVKSRPMVSVQIPRAATSAAAMKATSMWAQAYPGDPRSRRAGPGRGGGAQPTGGATDAPIQAR